MLTGIDALIAWFFAGVLCGGIYGVEIMLKRRL